MRKLTIVEHVSLDGVIQNTDEDGFPYGDWAGPYRTPEGRDAMLAAYGDDFDLLLGRRTYDMWSQMWPHAPSSPFGDRINSATKYIATHRPDSLEWGPVEALGADVVEGIRRLKSGDGPGVVLSGSSTVSTVVLEHGLADDLMLAMYPVVLGTGKRFLADGAPAQALELVDTRAMPSGIIFSRYTAAGRVNAG